VLASEGMAATEVAASDVVKLMLQFCKENSLQRTMQVLQEESGTTMNTVENVDSFISDINNGRWDSVLGQIVTLSLPQAKLVNLYEQVRSPAAAVPLPLLPPFSRCLCVSARLKS
jgi:WD40 repeat-containing protein SMU1